MNAQDYSPRIAELLAKIIILSRGGNIYPGEHILNVPVQVDEKTIREMDVTNIHYTPGKKYGGYFVYYKRGYENLDNCISKDRIISWILERYRFPDRDLLICEKMLSERLALREKNMRFISNHGDMNIDDFMKIDAHQTTIEHARNFPDGSPVPVPGDIVEGVYYGDHPYKWGILLNNRFEKDKFSVCAEPYVPFVCACREEPGYALSVSGGPFLTVTPDRLEYIGPDSRLFCDWGHEGPCADGAVDFSAGVSRWRVKPEKKTKKEIKAL